MLYLTYLLVEEIKTGGGSWPIVLVLDICSAAAYWRLVRTRLDCYEHGIRIINFLSSRSYRWDAIERFSVGTALGAPRVAIAHLRDGGRARIAGVKGVNRTLFPGDGAAERVVGELNRLLLTHRNVHQ